MLSSSISPTEVQLHNPFDDEASVALIEPDIDLTGQSTTKPTEPQKASPTVTGNIGSINNISQQQQQYEDTLDEPVSVTIVNIQTNKQKKSWLMSHV
jgi:hypothetical protein